MTRRTCLITQADIRRATAAARQAGATWVVILPDGCILARFDEPPPVTDQPATRPVDAPYLPVI